MRILLLASLLSFTLLNYVEAQDSMTKAALYDIEKYEKQAKGLTPKRKANIKRALNGLKMARQRLEKSTNKNHPAWINADKRLENLKAYLEQLMAGGAKPKNTSPTTTTNQNPQTISGGDAAITESFSALSALEKKIQRQSPGDKNAANTNIVALQNIRRKLILSKTKSHPNYQKTFSLFFNLHKKSVALANTSTAAPIDPAIKKASMEIEAIAKEVATSDRSKAQSLVNRLFVAENSLLALPEKTHPTWTKVLFRGIIVQHQVFDLANKRVQPAAVEPSVTYAIKEMDKYEGLFKALKPGDVRTANKYLAELKPLVTKLNAAKQKSHPSWKEVVRRYNALNKQIVARANEKPPIAVNTNPNTPKNHKNQGPELLSYHRVYLNRMGNQIFGSYETLQKMEIKKLQLDRNVIAWRNKLEKLKAGMGKYPELNEHPQVKEINAKLAETEALLEKGAVLAKKQIAHLGDFQKRLLEIEASMKNKPLPKALKYPFTPEYAQEFVTSVQTIEKEAKADLEFLTEIYQKVELPSQKYQENGQTFMGRQDVERLKYWVGGHRQEKAKKLMENAISEVDRQADSQSRNLEWFEKLDPKNRNHQANHFLGKDSRQKVLARLQKKIDTINMAISFDKAANRKGSNDRQAQLKKIQRIQADYEQKYLAALAAIRMPEPNSTDPKLLKIAKEVLSNPKYGVNKIERMIVNYDVHRKERKEGDVDSGVVKTTITVYHYVWDEYQVTTAEKVGDKYFLFCNTLKYYYSGDNTTPTKRWILNKRFQSSQIPKENIHK